MQTSPELALIGLQRALARELSGFLNRNDGAGNQRTRCKDVSTEISLGAARIKIPAPPRGMENC